MRRLEGRLSALESRTEKFRPWHRIIAEEGESEAQAIARYEAEHVPLGEDSCFIIRFVV